MMTYERYKRGANIGCEKRICHNKVSSQTLTDCILETKSKATLPNPWAFPRENTFAYSFTVSEGAHNKLREKCVLFRE